MGRAVRRDAQVAAACKRAATRAIALGLGSLALAAIPPRGPVWSAPAHPDEARMAADVYHLSATIGPRPAGTRSERLAARFVAHRLAALGYSVRLQPFPVPGGRHSANVIATKPALQPLLLVGAHYDSRPGSPGAEDNGSGVAVLLEVARILAEGEWPVQFVAFGAEERLGRGRRNHHFGSRHYVHTARAEHLARLAGMFSIDCVGSGPRFRVQGHSRDGGRLARRCRELAWAHRLTPEGGRAPMNSDHAPFARIGVPVAYFFRVPHPQTHTRRDQPTRVNRSLLRETAVAVLLAIEDILSPATPSASEPPDALLRPYSKR